MGEKRRTLTFAAVALVSIGIAAVTHWATRPQPHEEYELVGQEFFPKFQDPNEARSLHVAAFSDETATVKEFTVEFKDGMWRIPSHHDYPADAADRLADTAASIIGIKRGALASQWPSEHVQYGVFDPLSDDTSVLNGRGQRITLKKGDGSILADYIIGKPAEDFGDGFYYVRNPGEEETYIAELKINLSTDFADWIEEDLLKLERDNLVKIVIDRYSIDEVQRQIVGEEKNVLTRGSWSDPWNLEELDEQTEELKTDEVRDLVGDLDGLKIVGVRPKPPGLKPDLSIDTEAIQQQLQLDALIADMMSKGFFITRDQKLVSNEGEVSAATNEGIVYSLHFGEIFSGTDFEIEVGFASKDDGDGQNSGESDSGEQTAAGENKTAADGDGSPGEQPGDQDAEDNKKSDLKRSRYLFVTAKFDPTLIEEPQQPVEPEKPATSTQDNAQETQEPVTGEPGADSTAGEAGGETANEESAGAEQESPDADTPPAESDGSQEGNPAGTEESSNGASADDAQDDPMSEYEKAMEQYKKDLEKYENDRSQYDGKLKKGRETVDELNQRFGGWYYVISAESFENLRLSRADLVKPKEQETQSDENDPGQSGDADAADAADG